MKETVRDKIIRALKTIGRPLAEHEFPYCGTSSSCLTRELRRMQKEGLVIGTRRRLWSGILVAYKEWKLVAPRTEQ
jgi:hypothetical protein